MSESFKALVINQEGENFTREVKELNFDFINDGDVLVKIDYSDLNYKDALILNDGAKLVKDFPRIPGIDFSGIVEKSDTNEFKEGDEVILTGCRVGELFHGGFAQYAKVKKEFLIKRPKNITSKQAMIMGTAGFTALLCAFAVKAKEELLMQSKVNDVLVTGSTGAVGQVAVMVLSKMGCNVTALTGKIDKTNYLKELGKSKIKIFGI